MKLTTKGRYAVTAILDVALRQKSGPISLADISSRQDISLSYLEQLFSKLKKHQLVKSVRGPGGGYLLGKSPVDINIAEIILAVNEPLDATRCRGKGNCRDGETCLTHHLWQDLSHQIQNFLTSITLANLLERSETKYISEKQDAQFEGQHSHKDTLILDRLL
ncbi:MAG: Fe-S cluster assembly transcriptional regulator IscR [Gammaproteobacteria bacterium CG22_combo_CG10-13_8_21_14_all_40_8]|nr:MAG: Fe-S cluster assembly transcriptional regulator IscR [Gammaproteobacteria bacterium CG22_combo_CG10-13_8_21_14_all_40_8]